MIKKLTKFVLMFLVLISLSSCDPASFKYEYGYLEKNIVEIKLIEYRCEERKEFISWVPDYSDELLSFDFSKMIVLETLLVDQHEEFFDALINLDILYEYYTYNAPDGLCIMMIHKNGDFEILNCDKNSYQSFICIYYSDGSVNQFIGSFAGGMYYELLVEAFFDKTSNK
jgi:hypothetical protein